MNFGLFFGHHMALLYYLHFYFCNLDLLYNISIQKGEGDEACMLKCTDKTELLLIRKYGIEVQDLELKDRASLGDFLNIKG